MKHTICDTCSHIAAVSAEGEIQRHDYKSGHVCSATGRQARTEIFDTYGDAKERLQEIEVEARADAPSDSLDENPSNCGSTSGDGALPSMAPIRDPVEEQVLDSKSTIELPYRQQSEFGTHQEWIRHCQEKIFSGEGAPPTDTGSSIWAVSGGLPGLGRRR